MKPGLPSLNPGDPHALTVTIRGSSQATPGLSILRYPVVWVRDGVGNPLAFQVGEAPFAFAIPKGNYQIQVLHDDYQTVSVSVTADQTSLDLTMIQKAWDPTTQ